MARSKGYTFTTNEQQRAAYAKALGHPARARIVSKLQQREFLTYEEILGLVALAPGSLTNHLEQLDRVNLLRPYPLFEGKTGYALNRDRAHEAERLLSTMLNPFRGSREWEEELGEVG